MRAVALCAAAALLAALATAAPTIDGKTQTVTGISAGGAMAVQYDIAYSTTVRAAGIIAGIPYYCSQSSGLATALECMSDPETINVKTLNWEMNVSASEGNIDPVEAVSSQAIMLFSGIFDTVVNHETMVAVQQQYKDLNVARLQTYFNYSAEHAWITNFYGETCSHLGTPFINNCNLDFAGEFLKMAFEHMGEKWNPQRGTFNASNMFAFSQTDFGADAWTNSMDSQGYYYVPAQCQAGSTSNTRCHLHVNFHGCEQQRGNIGSTYVDHTGLNEWAETNNIVIVYPQAAANEMLENPNACFDWWGYTGSHYADKYGAQMAMTAAIVERLISTGSLPPAGWKQPQQKQ